MLGFGAHLVLWGRSAESLIAREPRSRCRQSEISRRGLQGPELPFLGEPLPVKIAFSFRVPAFRRPASLIRMRQKEARRTRGVATAIRGSPSTQLPFDFPLAVRTVAFLFRRPTTTR